MNYSQASSDDTSSFYSSSFTPENERSGNVRIIQGRYIGDIPSSKGRLKYLQIQQNDEKLLIKLSKPISYTLADKLRPGMMLQVWVRPKKDYLKALMVVPAGTDIATDVESPCISDDSAELDDLPQGTTITPKQKTCTLKVCTKGKCYKQGGRQVMQALEAAIARDDDASHITIRPTGCLKNCKHGPTIQVSPGSETYSFVRPQDVPTIVSHHMAH